ncbi:TIGR04283 family arsenosugar biosynthesis glycosyltransferase [Marinobacter sp. 1Y8]
MFLPLHLTIVMPVLNEADGVVAALEHLQDIRSLGHQVIVVDGGSTDQTVARAEPFCDRVVTAPAGRSSQMNAGASIAGGEVLLFLHADTRLPATALEHLSRFVQSDSLWGRFDVRLSGQRTLFRVISWFMNRRSRLTGIATGDQAIFARRAAFHDAGGYAPLPLMEDVALSRQLLALSRPFCISDPVVTDSRRWEKHGPWRTIFLMWRLRWRYWRGEDPHSLARAYYPDAYPDERR